MNSSLPAVQSVLFPISQLLPQRLQLRTELVDDVLEILNAGQLLPDWLGSSRVTR